MKTTTSDYDSMSFYLPAELIEYLDDLADKTDRSRSQVLKLIITQHKEEGKKLK